MTNDNSPPHSNESPSGATAEPSAPADNMKPMENILAHGAISNMHGVMRWGSNYAALVTVSGTNTSIIAVYKPRRGERPLWDFPDGSLCQREVAAYHVSQALGWLLVPPTVLRDGPHGIGSLQLFIPHNPEINYFALDDSFSPQLQRYAIFDCLINNADRKGGHLLLDDQGKLWGIDHGLSFHRMFKLRTVIWDYAGQSIAESMLESVHRLRDHLETQTSTLRQQLAPLLSLAEIHALIRRTEQLIEQRTYPQPGTGANYPWPPV